MARFVERKHEPLAHLKLVWFSVSDKFRPQKFSQKIEALSISRGGSLSSIADLNE